MRRSSSQQLPAKCPRPQSLKSSSLGWGLAIRNFQKRPDDSNKQLGLRALSQSEEEEAMPTYELEKSIQSFQRVSD